MVPRFFPEEKIKEGFEKILADGTQPEEQIKEAEQHAADSKSSDTDLDLTDVSLG